MRLAVAIIAGIFLTLSHGYRPLRPQVKRTFPKANPEQVGEPLFLTPYIDIGDIETGRALAAVDPSLLEGRLESYMMTFTKSFQRLQPGH